VENSLREFCSDVRRLWIFRRICRDCSTSRARLTARAVRRERDRQLTFPEVMARSNSSVWSSSGKEMSQLSCRVRICNPRPGTISRRSISVIGNARCVALPNELTTKAQRDVLRAFGLQLRETRFSREYPRLFGAPPQPNVRRIRAK
jgi:hypothetical protein